MHLLFLFCLFRKRLSKRPSRDWKLSAVYQILAFFTTIDYHKDMQVFWQALLLLLSFGFVFIWQQTFLSQYTLYLLGFLVTCDIVISVKKKNFNLLHNIKNDLWGLFILNTVILLVVLMSGNFSSPLFFLLYFLSFGVAFAYHPVTLAIFITGLLSTFLPYALREDVARNIALLGSLVFLSPIAFFFGRKIKT